MKILAALALFVIGFMVIAAEPDRADTGKVVEVSSDGITLDRATAGTVRIGFVTDIEALTSLKEIRIGDEVRAVFGSTQGPDGHSINKLLSIRVCTKNDEQCAADYKRQEIEEQDSANNRAIAWKKYELCNDSMRATLTSDTRYLSNKSVPVSDTHLDRYNALKGTARTCAVKLLRVHETSVLEACLLHHCGDSIGGGCWHIASYATDSSAIQNATNKCSE